MKKEMVNLHEVFRYNAEMLLRGLGFAFLIGVVGFTVAGLCKSSFVLAKVSYRAIQRIEQPCRFLEVYSESPSLLFWEFLLLQLAVLSTAIFVCAKIWPSVAKFLVFVSPLEMARRIRESPELSGVPYFVFYRRNIAFFMLLNLWLILIILLLSHALH